MEHRTWHKGGLLSADTASASFELSYFIHHKDQEFAKAISECISAVADVTLSGSERCESGRIEAAFPKAAVWATQTVGSNPTLSANPSLSTMHIVPARQISFFLWKPIESAALSRDRRMTRGYGLAQAEMALRPRTRD